MNSQTQHIPTSKGRSLLVLCAAVVGTAVTLRLGWWQLSRAEEKIGLQTRIDAQTQREPLSAPSLLQNPALWAQEHRRVVLEGQWLSDKTVYLDNRSHRGRPGFWVMTPLLWSPGQVVWVQRGWVARDPVSATQAAPVQTPHHLVRVEARIAPAPSHLTELGVTDAVNSPNQPLRIRANLALTDMQAMVAEQVNAVVVQTGPDSEGLSRDWPAVALTADKNKAYAFQWFALSGLIVVLCVWFQWIGPWRHAKENR